MKKSENEALQAAVTAAQALVKGESKKLSIQDIPSDHPVQPLKDNEPAKSRATCGSCGLSWDDGISTSMTPTPSARCPFEYFHQSGDTKKGKKKAVSVRKSEGESAADNTSKTQTPTQEKKAVAQVAKSLSPGMSYNDLRKAESEEK